ncbi:hypothetical protein HII17_13675 [Thalassotalea sp. M1531]|uniref:DUF4760 domain-containing protein n=1 Tax=Thalassotalea algicola TaxID=2716224 RepID=A0A7Y0LF88_9GAMM|nr:hypothetical protein [Thalassotalea algicola]NMP32611.1 hypothetical protein [Thalassotalea algicola]
MDLLFRILEKIFNPISDKYKDIANGVLLALMSLAWWFLVLITVERIEQYSPELLVRVFSLIGVSIGVYVAIWKLVNDQQWRRSEAYLEQAKELFEKAFNALKLDPETNYPVNDRYAWLSSSRLLLAALDLGKKIEDRSHKETFEEYMEFWRVQFADLLKLDQRDILENDYFYQEGALIAYTPEDRAPIPERAIAVLYRFLQWPEGREDRLSYEDNFSDEELKRIEVFGASSIYHYCRERRRAIRGD